MPSAKIADRAELGGLIDPRFVKAMSHPLRVEIMAACTVAPISEAEFRARHPAGESHQMIRYHWEILRECEVIEHSYSHLVRGKWVPYYVATQRALFTEEHFSELPAVLRGCVSGSVVATFVERTAESLSAGTLDSRLERHLTWTPLVLDLDGFRALMSRLDGIFEWLEELSAESQERLQESGERPMYTTLGMFGFESPAPQRDDDDVAA
jgi:hypothetical protein